MGRVFKPKRKKKHGTTWTSRKWWIEFTDETGRKTARSASTDKKVAQSLLRKAEEEVEQIRLGLDVARPRDLLLTDLATQFLKDMELHLRPKTRETYEDALNALLVGSDSTKPELRVKKVSDLTPSVIKDYQARASKTLSPRSVNKRVTILGTMLNWAVDNQMIRANPIKGVRMLPHRAVRTQRALTDEEIAELLLAADEESKEVWILFLETGLRKKEMATLQWKDIDFEAGEIHVRPEEEKSKRGRRIPMTRSVRQILEHRHERAQPDSDDIVIPKIGNRGFYHYILRVFDSDLEAAGIDKEGVHIHGLRRTFATRLIKAGANPKTVQTLMGHATLELTLQLYTDANAMDLKDAVDQLPDLEVREAAIFYLAG